MYKVIKEYCGIEKGTKVNSKSKTTVNHMVSNGYWEKIEPVERKKKVEPMNRQKK